MLLIGAYNLRYKQLDNGLKNNYIMGLDGYPQEPPVFMKLLKSYISEIQKTETPGRPLKKKREKICTDPK